MEWGSYRITASATLRFFKIGSFFVQNLSTAMTASANFSGLLLYEFGLRKVFLMAWRRAAVGLTILSAWDQRRNCLTEVEGEKMDWTTMLDSIGHE